MKNIEDIDIGCDDLDRIMDAMVAEGKLVKDSTGRYHMTNEGEQEYIKGCRERGIEPNWVLERNRFRGKLDG